MRRCRVLPLALTLFVAQPAFPVPVQVEPPEAVAVRAFIDDHLISLEGAAMRPRFRQGDQHFTLLDEEWLTAFKLVPAAHELALQMRESYSVGTTLLTVGLLIESGAALGVGVIAIMGLAGASAFVTTSALIITALVFAGVGVIGAVIAACSIPFMAKVTAQFFEVVSVYNHGLTRRPMTIVPNSPSAPVAPLLQFSI